MPGPYTKENNMTQDILKFAEEYTMATDEVEIVFGEPLREHTSFRVGGNA